ncbi:MAG TPA: hypothetical protein VN969_02245 [Streptosporangiaceae bacterium]|nr:hypothetical protein [Streptosporangiaceae bacterium]
MELVFALILASPGHAVTARFGDPLPPLGVTVACRIAMGAAMAFMLLIMI